TGSAAQSTTSGVQTITNVAAKPNAAGPIPGGIGTVTKLAGGVVYFNGYKQIDDPYKSQVSTLNGLQTGFNNKAIVGPNGQVILVNPQPGQIGSAGYSTFRGPGSFNLDMD